MIVAYTGCMAAGMSLLSERQTGGPKVATSHAPQAWGLGYGAASPMSTVMPLVPIDEVPASGAAATHAQAERAGEAARSAA